MTTATDWRSWPPDQKRLLLERLQDRRAETLRERWEPYPWQRPHHHPAEWRGVCGPDCADLPDLAVGTLETWLMMGGRGTGKTDGGAEYVLRHASGPACDPRAPGGHRIGIVAPTLGDAVESCVTGLSGLQAHDPRVKLRGSRGGTFAMLHGGARARLFGAHTPDDVNRFRAGGNTCLLWLEEAAAMRYLHDVLEQAPFGLRVGPSPHMVVSTTPKNRPEVKAWLTDPTVHLTRGRTTDATHLDQQFRDRILERNAGTTTGRQELDGEVLDDVDGALWERRQIDPHRVDRAPALGRIVVAVDPNAGGPDECGIVVIGIGAEPEADDRGYKTLHLYVLEDLSKRFANPGQWGRAVVLAYNKWEADSVVAEVNNGGDMVPHVIRTVEGGTNVPVRSVTATRGKARRAEPVVSLYEMGRVHHVGMFAKLEDQQTTWVEGDTDSPDRMDALVWGATDLAGLATGTGKTRFAEV